MMTDSTHKTTIQNSAMQPLVSIITVSYNAEQFIEQTILSVIKQTYLNIEYIIIDGASTDSTTEIIKKYNSHISYWISEPDQGVYDAMNKGTRLAGGEWIYFLGAGDILFNVLDRIAIQFKRSNTVYYGNVYKLDELKVYNGKFAQHQLAVRNICHQAVFYPASVFQKYQYNLRYRLFADHDLNMRINGDKHLKFEYLNVVVGLYEGDGISANLSDGPFYQDRLNIVKQNFPMYVYYYARLRSAIAKIFKKKSSKIV